MPSMSPTSLLKGQGYKPILKCKHSKYKTIGKKEVNEQVKAIYQDLPPPFFGSPATPISFHLYRVPLSVCSGRLCGMGAGRCFSIIPAGFGCEMGIDAWVDMRRMWVGEFVFCCCEWSAAMTIKIY
jgi:hypothetical protein